jgi:hypothetical protein
LLLKKIEHFQHSICIYLRTSCNIELYLSSSLQEKILVHRILPLEDSRGPFDGQKQCESNTSTIGEACERKICVLSISTNRREMDLRVDDLVVPELFWPDNA